jgi:hypothetical protein
MHRALLFKAWHGVFAQARPRDWAGAGVAALLCLLVLATAAAILAWPNEAIWDQARLLEARFERPFHPAPPFGFTAQLCVIAIKGLLPAGAPANEAVRIFAMAFWAGAACWLALAALARRTWVVVLLLALFSSQLPFLWLSTELIAGGFLFLALGAWLRGWPPTAVGALLALLALCKPDLVLVSLTLAVCFGLERPSTRRPLAWGLGLTLVVLLAPGLMLLGPDYLTAYGPDGRGRSFAAFSQHFAALVAPFQLAPTPDPWAQPGPYVERTFPGARSMLEVIRAPGAAYLDHVALSLSRGVRKIGWLLQWAWLAVPLLVMARRRSGLGADAPERALLLSFVGCVPFVLFAYPHIRYFARYFPLFWILLLMSLERLERADPRMWRRPEVALAGVCLVLALVVGVQRASIGLALAPGLPQYWFSD